MNIKVSDSVHATEKRSPEGKRSSPKDRVDLQGKNTAVGKNFSTTIQDRVALSEYPKLKKKLERAGTEKVLKQNDPKNPVTHDKLRKLLESGGFHFSAKERSVLEKILKK